MNAWGASHLKIIQLEIRKVTENHQNLHDFGGQNVNFPGSGSFVEWFLIEPPTFFFGGGGTEKPRGHPAICGRGIGWMGLVRGLYS